MHDFVSILLYLFDHPDLVGAAFVQNIEGEFGVRGVGVEGEGEFGLPVGDVEVGAVLESLVVLALHGYIITKNQIQKSYWYYSEGQSWLVGSKCWLFSVLKCWICLERVDLRQRGPEAVPLLGLEKGEGDYSLSAWSMDCRCSEGLRFCRIMLPQRFHCRTSRRVALFLFNLFWTISPGLGWLDFWLENCRGFASVISKMFSQSEWLPLQFQRDLREGPARLNDFKCSNILESSIRVTQFFFSTKLIFSSICFSLFLHSWYSSSKLQYFFFFPSSSFSFLLLKSSTFFLRLLCISSSSSCWPFNLPSISSMMEYSTLSSSQRSLCFSMLNSLSTSSCWLTCSRVVMSSALRVQLIYSCCRVCICSFYLMLPFMIYFYRSSLFFFILLNCYFSYLIFIYTSATRRPQSILASTLFIPDSFSRLPSSSSQRDWILLTLVTASLQRVLQSIPISLPIVAFFDTLDPSILFSSSFPNIPFIMALISFTFCLSSPRSACICSSDSLSYFTS